MVDHLAHQPDKGEIDRIGERLGHGRPFAILPFGEIDKALRSTAGKKRAGACRIGPLHCRREHRFEAAILGVAEVIGRPFADRVVAGRGGSGQQLAVRQRRELAVQCGDDVEIGDQRAQLCRRAQHQLGPGIDVERLVQAIGANSYIIGAGAALVEHDAPGEPRRAGAAQQLTPVEPQRSVIARIAELRQHGADAPLGALVDARPAAEVEVVERIIIWEIELRDELVAQLVARLVGDIGVRRGRCRFGGKAERAGESSVAQGRIDDRGCAQRVQIPVGQGGERAMIGVQVVGGAAAGQQQAQDLPINLAFAGELGRGCRGRGQAPGGRRPRSVPYQRHSASGRPMISP